MAAKELFARILHKRDTATNWEAQDPVLLDGEIIIVDTTDGKIRTKTGDGTSKYSNLTFNDEDIYAAISEAGGGSTYYDRILTTSGWTDGKQAISIDGLTAEQNGIVGLSQDISTTEYEAAAGAEMRVCSQTAGSLTVIYHGDKPTCDIPITVIVLN